MKNLILEKIKELDIILLKLTKEYLEINKYLENSDLVYFNIETGIKIGKNKLLDIIKIIEKDKMIIINAPKEYDNNSKTAGQIAKESNFTIGTIGCKHCGVTIHGLLNKTCDFCGNDLFE